MTLQWYKHNPKAFMEGVRGMSLEEIGAYTLLLNHMYDLGGPIADDPRAICHYLDCDIRVWRRLRTSLILKGKIVDTNDGYLFNRRVQHELQVIADRLELMRSRGRRGGELSAKCRAEALKDKEKTQPDGQPLGRPSGQPDKKDKITSPPSLRSVGDVSLSPSLRSGDSAPTASEGDAGKVVQLHPPQPVGDAVAAYNRVAEAQGWRRCRETTPTRRQQIAARLAKYGIDGWQAALALASKLEWVNDPESRSKDHRGWRATIDWFIRQRTFVMLFESADEETVQTLETPTRWLERIEWFIKNQGVWPDKAWGPPPGQPGCRVHETALKLLEQPK